MMTFRYHIVTVVSVFLALAVGIAIGGGPLKGEVDNSLVTQVETDRRTIATLESQLSAAKTTADFNAAAAGAVAPLVLGDRLAGHAVAVVALPGADPATVAALGDTVVSAGGTLAGSYRVAAALLDEEQRQLVDDLSAQLATEVPDLAADTDGYALTGALLARAIATSEDAPQDADQVTSAVLAGLSTAGLVMAEEAPEQRADLVLLAAGPAPESQLPGGAAAALSPLVGALAEGAAGVVLAGPTRAARPGGLLALLRDDLRTAGRVSTVDSAQLVLGQIVTVLTLERALAGEVGHHGAVDAADGAAPGS